MRLSENFKKIAIASTTVIGSGALLWYSIGNYFIKYALLPGQGAEDRQINQPEVSLKMLQNKMIIRENRKKFDEQKDKWLEETENLIQEVTIRATDGTILSGHTYIHEKPTDKWMIIVHGYQVDEQLAQVTAPPIYNAGYNILTMDLRAHGRSEGEYIGMGYLDQFDLVNWIDWLVDQHPNSKIALHGSSMGGATVLLTASQDLPPNVKAIIDDCGYSSIRDIFASELNKRFGVPATPILDMAGSVSKLRAGYNINDGDVLEATKYNHLPTLFIHGEVDDFVPVEMGQALYKVKPGNNKKWSVYKEAGHVEPKYSEPKRYYHEVITFSDKYLD